MSGLYIHIPFCRSKCNYCRFVSSADMRPEKTEQFLALLEKEIFNYEKLLSATEKNFDTVYLGGGTPSVLTPNQLERIFNLIHKNFSIAKDAEITIELNPGDIDRNKARHLKTLGINRVSIGAQTFDYSHLQSLGRKHSPEQTKTTFAVLKDAGFENISLDLMVSLPGQSVDEVENDVNEILTLNPGQVTVYELTIEPGTVFSKKLKDGALLLPDEKEQTKIINLVSSRFETAGFNRYELLSYARPGFESRHNLNYWHNGSYLGLGPGAFSYIAGTRSVFAPDIQTWFEKLEAGDFSKTEEEKLEGAKKECETLLLGLRLKDGVRLRDFPELTEHLNKVIPQLFSVGLVEEETGRLYLTQKGKLLAESVFEALVI